MDTKQCINKRTHVLPSAAFNMLDAGTLNSFGWGGSGDGLK